MKKVSVSHKGKTKKIRELKNEADIRKYNSERRRIIWGYFWHYSGFPFHCIQNIHRNDWDAQRFGGDWRNKWRGKENIEQTYIRTQQYWKLHCGDEKAPLQSWQIAFSEPRSNAKRLWLWDPQFKTPSMRRGLAREKSSSRNRIPFLLIQCL